MLSIGSLFRNHSHAVHIPHDKDPKKLADNCNTAAIIYGVFVALSIVMLIVGKIRNNKAKNALRQPLLPKAE